MHFDDGVVSKEYTAYIFRKTGFTMAVLAMLLITLAVGISLGAVNLPVIEVIKSTVFCCWQLQSQGASSSLPQIPWQGLYLHPIFFRCLY